MEVGTNILAILAGTLEAIFQYFQYLNIPNIGILAGTLDQYLQYLNIPNIGILVGRLEPIFQYFQYLNIPNIGILAGTLETSGDGWNIEIFEY